MLVCADLERSRNFYADVLKLPITSSTESSVEFELGNGATLGIHKRTRLLAVRPGSFQLGFSVDDVDTLVARARTLGAPIFQDPYDEAAARVAIISDPDGYPVQVVSDAKKRR